MKQKKKHRKKIHKSPIEKRKIRYATKLSN